LITQSNTFSHIFTQTSLDIFIHNPIYKRKHALEQFAAPVITRYQQANVNILFITVDNLLID